MRALPLDMRRKLNIYKTNTYIRCLKYVQLTACALEV